MTDDALLVWCMTGPFSALALSSYVTGTCNAERVRYCSLLSWHFPWKMKMKMGSLQDILWRAKPDPEQLDKQEAVKHWK